MSSQGDVIDVNTISVSLCCCLL